MTLCADCLLRAVVTGEARRIVTLSSCSVDLQDVRRDLCRCLRYPVTTVALRSVSVRLVLEIVESRGGSAARAVLQRHRPVGVTDSAPSELFARLMCVAAIALRVLREARLLATGGAMASLTFQLLSTGRPLRRVRVQVLAVREGFQSQLSEVGGKADQFRLSCERHLMTTCTELAVRR